MTKDVLKLLTLLAIVIFISMCISVSVGFIAQGFLMFSTTAASILTMLTFYVVLAVIGHKVTNSKNKFINFFF